VGDNPIVCCSPKAAMLAWRSRRRLNLLSWEMPEGIPIKDEVVDVVLCTEVIEHVYEFHQVLQEINRVLKKGGWLILTTPFSWGLHYEPNDYWRFTPYSLRRLLEERGFEVVKQVKIGGLFSLFGSRLVEGVALRLCRRDLKWLPPKMRHGMILIFSVPMSLVFYMAGNLLDRFISTDYIGNAVLARKANT